MKRWVFRMGRGCTQKWLFLPRLEETQLHEALGVPEVALPSKARRDSTSLMAGVFRMGRG